MAIACLRLVTFLPLRPLLSLPRFIACISRFTDLPAFGLYLRPEDFLPRLLEEDLRRLDDEEEVPRELLLRREREEPERVEALRRVPRCEEPRREDAEDFFPREDDLRPREELREERLRVDFLVAAMRI